MDQQFDNFESCYSSIDYPHIVEQQTFPVHPSDPYNDNETLYSINKIVQNYHNADWINIQDQILYMQQQQCMKRSYSASQQQNKIQLLGQYYRYHHQAPRIFIQDIFNILQDNIDDKRALEYQLVTEHMNDNNVSVLHSKLKKTNRIQPHDKLIQDIQLSYNNFQEKQQCPQHQQYKIDIPVASNYRQCTVIGVEQTYNQDNHRNTDRNRKGLTRTTSIKNKGQFYIFKVKRQQPQYRKQNKNGIKNNINVNKKQSSDCNKYKNGYKKPIDNSNRRSNARQISIKSKKADIASQPTIKKSIYPTQNKKICDKSNTSKINKIISANNSMVSSTNNRTMSRSQSRNQLNLVNCKPNTQNSSTSYKQSNNIKVVNKKQDLNSDYSLTSKIQTGLNSRNTSNQNSLLKDYNSHTSHYGSGLQNSKSSSKNKSLKNSIHAYKENNLGIIKYKNNNNQPSYKKQSCKQKPREGSICTLSNNTINIKNVSKPKQAQECSKKMFSKAIQIRKKRDC